MRKYLFLIIFAGLTLHGFAQEASKKDGPIITFEKSTHDFGDIAQGDKVEYTYILTNTGNEPLIIQNVEVSCGCTTPKGIQRDPIAPGAKSEIVIAFNSTGKIGRQNKTLRVVSNASNPEGATISFTANVIDKKPTTVQPQ